MIPGKKYRPEDFLEILWRRRWVLVAPLVICGIGTFLWSRTLPDKYRSQALILVVAPQVPENYVRPTVTESLQDQLTSMRQQILSRTRLERIILELNLYPEERKTLLMDEVVARMRNDVKMDVPRVRRRDEPGSFTIGFEYGDPKTAMVVTERIASLFVRENVEGRTIQADVTNQFLQSQVDDALRRLKEHETRLDGFKRANAGRLPSQVQSNLQVMQSTRQELQSLIDAINRDRDRQLTIERTIQDEEAIGTVAPPVKNNADGAQVHLSAMQELQTAKAALAGLELRLTPEHPDVRAAKRRIADLEKKAAAEALQQPISPGVPTGPVTAAEAARLRRLSALRAEFESLERNLTVRRAQADRLQKTLDEYKLRVEAAPVLESQLTELTRDHETLQGTYTTLLKKSQDARVASNLEERQVGQQFRIVDPARAPERPSSPDRLRMNMMGLLAGLGLGLGIAALLEYRDTSVRTEEDVLVALSLPVVALVPTVWTAAERRNARRRRLLLLGTSALATLVLSVAALAWKLRLFGN